MPRRERAERRPGAHLLAGLEGVGRLAGALGVVSRTEDFDTGLTTDDLPG